VKRRGFTLVELLIAIVLFGLLGTALARLMISNSRFVARQEAQLEARQTARAAMNSIIAELRMVSDGGLLAAAPESVTVRIPYAFGVLCRNEYALLTPPDSAAYAAAVPGGIAYRQPDGTYTFDATVTVTGTTASTADCDADSVRVVPGGLRITLSQSNIAPPATIFYLFQTVTYRFAPSVMLPGRKGLWRRVGATNEEILAPFATTARFAFLVGSRLTVQTAPPGTLSQIQGLELRLTGESENTPAGAAAPLQFALSPRVKFMNRPF
jgi:prepilin-type N-terminal cleavage/methylation domain-containing protein